MRRVKIAFFGTPDFAVPALRQLAEHHEVVVVVAQPDKPSGRGLTMHPPAIAIAAHELHLPLLQPARARDESFLQAIRDLSPDLGVVVAYGKILAPSLLAIPRLGFLNIHGSILPKYRGAAPIQRAIEAGETVTGVTIMRVDAELDHGPIFSIATTPIGPDERTPSLAARLSGIGAMALLPVIDALTAGTAVETPQEHDLATHAAKLEKQEGLVTWRESSKAIYDRFRAFDPWPGIFAEHAGETIKLIGIEREAGPSATPGRIAAVDANGVVVETGDGRIRIHTAQRPGKGRVHAEEMARALGWKQGSSFG